MDTIEAGLVAIIHYTLKNDQGEVLDSSDGGDPLPYLHGHNNIVPGLENALVGKKVGEEVSVCVSPQEGYGMSDPNRIIKVPRDSFPEDADVSPGVQFMMQDDKGNVLPVWVTQVVDTEVTIDANHPLAGQNLHFTVTVSSIRQPTEEEIGKGHPNGLTGTESHH